MNISQQPNINRRFGGIIRLYGEQAFSKFQAAHVCVIGLGGVGSWAVEALARSGIGQLTLIDLDNIAESNINRQIHALTPNLGREKVNVLAERIHAINPYCRVHTIEDFVDINNFTTLFANPFDFVIDAIDQVRIKTLLAHHFIQHQQPFVVSGSAGGQICTHLIQTADLSRVTHDPMLAKMRYTLRRHYGFSRNATKKMNIPCVFSTENITTPKIDSHCDTTLQGLSCSGYGSSMIVTASFGLHCAELCLSTLCRKSK